MYGYVVMQSFSQKEMIEILVAESYFIKKASARVSFSTVWAVAITIY